MILQTPAYVSYVILTSPTKVLGLLVHAWRERRNVFKI